MFVRLSFDDGQIINLDELEKIDNTLADKVTYDQMYLDEDNNLVPFYSYRHTLDPNDPSIAEEKKILVIKSDKVKLNANKEYFADLDLFMINHPSIKIKIRGMVKTVETNFTSLMEEIQYIYNKFETALKGFDKHIEFNEKCNVHIGNVGLLNINQIGYCEDQCTESLQTYLNQGWRILAICPQSNQRRPDYIMGRYNPNDEELTCVKL